MKTLMRACGLVVCTATCAFAQTEMLRLKNGEVLVGTVQLTTSGEVVVAARYPEVRRYRLEESDLAPESWFALLERNTDGADVDARMRLVAFAAQHRLFALAIAELRRIKEVAPGRGAEVEKRVARLRETVADDILADAKDALESSRPRVALMYLHTVRELFPKTTAARRVGKLMTEAHRAAGASAEIATTTVSGSRAVKLAEKIRRYLSAGDKSARRVGAHVGNMSTGTVQKRDLQRALRHYKKAWESAKRLPVTAPSEAREREQKNLRQRAKAALVRTYLELASIYLQRIAIPKAEDYCNAACELDPDKVHALHRQIIQAKIYRGY